MRTRQIEYILCQLTNWSNVAYKADFFSINRPLSIFIRIKLDCRNFLWCVWFAWRRQDTDKPLSTDAPSTHKGVPLGKFQDISAHIPPLLLSETWMIWLFDDSLFCKSVSAPYVSNMRCARSLNALPWGLWETTAVLKPGGRIGLWTQTCILHSAKAHPTGFKSTFKEISSPCSAAHVRLPLFSLFYYELIILLEATSAVFEYLDLSKQTKSSGLKLRKALSLFSIAFLRKYSCYDNWFPSLSLEEYIPQEYSNTKMLQDSN